MKFWGFIFLILANFAHAKSSGSVPSFSIPFSGQNATIDGKLDDNIWKEALKVTLSFETSPSENTPAPVETTAYLVENGETLFIAFDARDSNPDAIRAFLRDRDKSRDGDYVGIELDTFNDEIKSNNFYVNPLGVQTDGIYTNTSDSFDQTWDGIWNSAGSLSETGYFVEIGIPFDTLRFKEGEEKTWGINLIRFHPRDQVRTYSVTKTDRSSDCKLCQMGKLVGMKSATHNKQYSITPTYTLGGLNDLVTDEEITNEEVGVSATLGLNANTDFQLTYNPEYSQIEADAGRLSVNNPFTLFNSEKRPFFLENSEFINPGNDFVYTRNIATPEYGGKFTNTTGNHYIGLLAVKDTETNIIIPGNFGSSLASLESESDNLAMNWLFKAGDNVSTNTFATRRQTDEYHNQVLGINSEIRFDEQNTLKISAAGSETQDSQLLVDKLSGLGELGLRVKDTERKQGEQLAVSFKHKNRNWFGQASSKNVSESFRADLGFVTSIDYRDHQVSAGQFFYGSEETFHDEINLNYYYNYKETYDQQKLSSTATLQYVMVGDYSTFFNADIIIRERAGRRTNINSLAVENNADFFKESSLSGYTEFSPLSDLKLNLSYDIGEQINFGSAQPRLDDYLYLSPGIYYSVNEFLEIKLDYFFEKLGPNNVRDGQGFIAKLWDLRVNYQMNLRSAFRLSTIFSDIDTYTGDNFKNWDTQVFYNYEINPQTLFFLGASFKGEESDYFQPEDYFLNSDIPLTGISFFTKLSWAFQF